MGLDEEYPKACSRRTTQIRALLERIPDLDAGQRDELATALNQMADRAEDLKEIMDRLLTEPHSLAEIGELLIAFELTTEQLRGHSDTIDGKLYELADRLNPSRQPSA